MEGLSAQAAAELLGRLRCGCQRVRCEYACAAPVDMRRGFDGLSALVEEQLGGQLLREDVFLFVGRSRKRAKVRSFDGTGLVPERDGRGNCPRLVFSG